MPSAKLHAARLTLCVLAALAMANAALLAFSPVTLLHDSREPVVISDKYTGVVINGISAPKSDRCLDDPLWSSDGWGRFTCSWLAYYDPGCVANPCTAEAPAGHCSACPVTCGQCPHRPPPPPSAPSSPPPPGRLTWLAAALLVLTAGLAIGAASLAPTHLGAQLALGATLSHPVAATVQLALIATHHPQICTSVKQVYVRYSKEAAALGTTFTQRSPLLGGVPKASLVQLDVLVGDPFERACGLSLLYMLAALAAWTLSFSAARALRTAAAAERMVLDVIASCATVEGAGLADAGECPICMDDLIDRPATAASHGGSSSADFAAGEEPGGSKGGAGAVVSPPCGHLIHRDCLAKWVATKMSEATCPLCKTRLIPRDAQTTCCACLLGDRPPDGEGNATEML